MPGPSPEDYAPLAPGESSADTSPSRPRYPQLALWARRLISSSIIALFCIGTLSLGLVDHFAPVATSNITLGALGQSSTLTPKAPDHSRYGKTLKTVSSQELRLRKGGRMIIVGDIHGMKDSLDHLLKKIRYKPHKDTLIHTGDTLTKGLRPFETLSFLAANNITGVRGNHDQQIIEWHSWFNWVRSFPDGPDWIDRYHDHSVTIEIDSGSAPQDQLIMGKKPDTEKFPFPDNWKWAGEHWRIARTMTEDQYEYLLSLPLVLHIPSLHTLVVHGGLVPVDPTRGVTRANQPLARVPELPDGVRRRTKELREAQELAVVLEIPQNQDPWANLNIRSILIDGKISRKNDEGSPWSTLWNKIMKRCNGFDNKPRKKDHLPCYPFTVIYGHAASRGLENDKWSKGLDSGCVYGRQLTALVYSEVPSTAEDGIDVEGDDIEVTSISLGDNPGTARLVSVSCQI